MVRLAHVAVRVVLAGAAGGSVFALAQPTVFGDELAPDDEADEDVANVPPDRYVPDSEKALVGMRGILQKGLDEVMKARQDRDSVRLLCVNEPVTAMKGTLRIAENANVDLQSAMSTGELVRAKREFLRIRQGRRQMETSLLQAQNCAGAVSSESSTSVDVEFDPRFLTTDPYYGEDSFFYDPTDDLIEGSDDQLGERDSVTLRPPPASGVV